jgi:hypothetical protein
MRMAVTTLVVSLAALIPRLVPVQASETFTGFAPDWLGALSPSDRRIGRYGVNCLLGLRSSEHGGDAF